MTTLIDSPAICRIQEIKEKVRLTSDELQQTDMDLEENQGKG